MTAIAKLGTNLTNAETSNTLADRAYSFAAQSKSANTRRAYSADWSHFTNWCAVQGKETLPAAADTVKLYLTDLADCYKVSTLTRRVAAISQAHQVAGFPSPTQESQVRLVLAGIRRVNGTATTSKRPLLTDDLRQLVTALLPTAQGRRDRALLLLGFAGAFRRSELVNLDIDDLQFLKEGVVATLRRSKTDQEGQGRQIGIPFGSNSITCPVRALQAWLDIVGDSGPLFRSVDRHGNISPKRLSDKAVALVVQSLARRSGLSNSDYAGHSLRAGFATSSAAAGASERSIMAQTGHKSLAIARRYIRHATIFADNAAVFLGL